MSSVHSTHCCKKHGCKYGNEDCPVVLGVETQEYKQECCEWEESDLFISYHRVIDDLSGIKGGDEVAEFLRIRLKEAGYKRSAWH